MNRQFLIGIVTLFFSLNESSFSQVSVDFRHRTSLESPLRSIYSINGDFSMIGNTNLTLQNYGDNLMNDGMMVFVDVDSDPSTFNSSSAFLEFSKENGANSSCTKVLFAGLYWSGRGPSDIIFNNSNNGVNRQFDKRKLKIKGPGQQNYIELEALDNEIRFPESLNDELGLFVGFKEVTTLVRDWGEGEYTVADIGLLEGTNYHYGGWGMVIVYENPLMKKRDVSVFDGYAFVRGQGSNSFDIPVSGFSAADVGEVKVKLGVMAGEGDVGASGDYLAIETGINTNNFERLSHGGNDNNNFFNSSIYTGVNSRNPYLKNNTGMDISVFELDNQGNRLIQNNQTSTKFQYGSDWDVYVIYNITMAIDANDVKAETMHEFLTKNGEPVENEIPEVNPGDTLEILTTIKNKGDIAIDKTRIEIPLPQWVGFLNAEPNLIFNEKSNGNYYLVDDENQEKYIGWEIGELPVPEDSEDVLGTFKYSLVITEVCDELVLICNNELSIDGLLYGENSLTQTSLDPIPFIQGYSQSTECMNLPIEEPLVFMLELDEFLNDNCGINFENLEIQVCVPPDNNLMVSEFSNSFPAGSLFYLNPPIDPDEPFYIESQYVPMPTNKLTLYTKFTPEAECYREFKVVSSEIVIEPVVINTNSCEEAGENEIGVLVSGGVQPYSYVWDDFSNATSPTLKAIEAGEYRVTVTDSLGCSVQGVVSLPEPSPFSFEILELESNLELDCDEEGLGSIVIDVEGENSPFVVDIVEEYEDDFPYTGQILLTEGGRHQITNLPGGTFSLYLKDSKECVISKMVEIEEVVQLDRQVSFSYYSDSYISNQVLYQNTEIQFISEVDLSEGLTYYWDFGNGQESNQRNPLIQYNEKGQYLIKLIVRDEFGCEISFEELIEINESFLRVPTAFSPSGDNINDYFFPVFSRVSNIQFWVFNRWGELFFFTDDPSSKGWDGNHNGQKVPNGRYAYKLIYTDMNGIEKQEKGGFSLIR
tara:strand:- start:45203 stop:48160 length:2958 start_codon:yes stop_codon:yes gene_type:complete